jgi:hypothetical protein
MNNLKNTASVLKISIKGVFIILFIAFITYYCYINFNYLTDTAEATKYGETRKRDRDLYVKMKKVVQEFYYGQP